MKVLCTAAVLVLAFAGCAAADDSAPISATDKAHMSPQTFGRRMVGQLYENMTLPESSRTPNSALTAFNTSLRPTGTEVRGLCRRQFLDFELGPAADVEPDAKTPMRLEGVNVVTAYHFLSPPKPGDKDMSAAERRDLNRRCASLKETDFDITADSALNARDGVLVVAALKEKGDLIVPCLRGSIDCKHIDTQVAPGFFSNRCDVSLESKCVLMSGSGIYLVVRFRVVKGEVSIVSLQDELYIDDIQVTGFREPDYIK